MAKELPKRSEVKEEYTWDVSAMYASKTAWEADLKEVDAIVSDLAKLEGSVMASAEKLLAALELGARAEQKIDLAFNYAERLFDQDQKNTEHQAMSQKMYGVVTDYQSRTAFVVPEILAADKATLAQYFAENKELELYRGLVDEILRTKEHVLSAEMEKLVAMTGEITLRGRVLPIGGLKEKLLSALRGGIKTVIIPKENEKDLEEIPENVKTGMKIIPVSDVKEVIKIALKGKVKPLEEICRCEPVPKSCEQVPVPN